MKSSSCVRLLVVVAASALLGCGQPQPPQTPGSGDGSELTCDEKARAELLCRDAMRQRCDSQERDCESNCTHVGSTLNDDALTTKVTVMEPEQCRQNCSHGHDGCLATIAPRCPVRCP